jgi:hypothetical protein
MCIILTRTLIKMDTPTFELNKDEAEKLYNEYAELVTKREEEHLEILKKCYFHLKEGRKILNVFDVIEKAGVDDLHKEPTLAIANAAWHEVTFSKLRFKSGIFGNSRYGTRNNVPKDFIELPPNLFTDEWKNTDIAQKSGWFSPERQYIKTAIPLIPAILMPRGALSNYYILFEVTNWEEAIDRRKIGNDPFLLRRISENMFVILASWDVSPIEQAVLEGIKP